MRAICIIFFAGRQNRLSGTKRASLRLLAEITLKKILINIIIETLSFPVEQLKTQRFSV